jgi:integral membrane protein
MLKSKTDFFKLVATLEGISFLFLLGVAMPLKYLWYRPEYVEYGGMAHGVLFVAYVLAVAVLYRKTLKWSIFQAILGLVLSFVPFGTFYVTANMMPAEA